MTVAPQAARLLREWARSPDPAVEELTPARVRADELAVLQLQSAPPELYAVGEVELAADPPLKARVYRPRPGPLPTIVYLHGGGFVSGPETYDVPLRELASATGCAVVAPRYRLAPEHRFPAALADAIASVRSVVADAAETAGDSVPVGVAGDSAGGNLAAAATRQLTREGLPLGFQVLIYPIADATTSSASYVEFASGYGLTSEKCAWYLDQYVPPEVDRRNPRVSPLFESDLGGLPPTLVATAEFDPLRDEGELYARRLESAGVATELRRYDGMIHGFFQMSGSLDAARQLQRDIASWLEALIARGRPDQVKRS